MGEQTTISDKLYNKIKVIYQKLVLGSRDKIKVVNGSHTSSDEKDLPSIPKMIEAALKSIDKQVHKINGFKDVKKKFIDDISAETIEIKEKWAELQKQKDDFNH